MKPWMCWNSAHYWHCLDNTAQSSGMRAVPGRIPEEPHLWGFGKMHWITDCLAKEGRGTVKPSSLVCPVTSVLSTSKMHSWAVGATSALGPGTAQPLTSHGNRPGWENLGWEPHKHTFGVIKSSNNLEGFLCPKSTTRAMFSPAAWMCMERL